MTDDPNSGSDKAGTHNSGASADAQDDRIIGTAVRWSVIAVSAALLLFAAGWWLTREQDTGAGINDAQAIAPQPVQTSVLESPPEVVFHNVTKEVGIDFRHHNGAYGERLLPETMGGGVAFLDYDNDGYQDLLFVDSGRWPWREETPTSPALYRNLGNGAFENVTAKMGLGEVSVYGMGIASSDINGDGYPELFLTAVGENRLLLNRQGQGFTDITDQAGLAGQQDAWSTGAAFFDFDLDGDLDLFVCNYVQWSRDVDLGVDFRLTGIGRAYGPPTHYAGTHSYLYRNEGDGRFTDISAEAGIQVNNAATGLPAGKSLAVITPDLDNDGWPDIVIANDTVRNFMFRNLGDGTFEESGIHSGLAFDNSGAATGAMGMDSGRYNNADEVAIAVGNFANEMTSFYVSRDEQALFTDEAITSGIGPASREALSFGVFFFDYDLDGRLDLLQTNGHVEDQINTVQASQHYRQPTQLFWNCGNQCSRNFVAVPPGESGDLATPVVGRGAAYGDYDLDGDLDVVITQINDAPLLLRNDQQLGHHWVRIQVEGIGGNRDAIGAQVSVTAGELIQTRSVTPGKSYLSQMELPVTFGLGDHATAVAVEVVWPDGMRKSLEDVMPDQVLRIGHPNADTGR